jgi:hypothetical protein
MALQVEVDCLNKDELVFELRVRGLDVDEEYTLDELKQRLRAAKGLTPDVNKVNAYVSTLSFDDEFQTCEDSGVSLGSLT